MSVPILSVPELLALPPREELVRGILDRRGFGAVFGAPGTGKSWLMLDLGLGIAGGRPAWLGHDILEHGAVVYVCAEGVGGLADRVIGWCDWHQPATVLPFYVVPEAIDVRDGAAVEALVSTVRTAEIAPVLVVLDTLARCMPGADENAARDMGEAIAGLDRIGRDLDALVLAVHHTTKDGGTERGSSALRGAADVLLSVASDGDRLSTTCTKRKHGLAFEDVDARLQVVELDEDNPHRTSCVVVPFDGARGATSETARRLLIVLRDAFDAAGATIAEWHRASALPHKRGSEVPESTVRRVRGELLGAKLIEQTGKGRGALHALTAAGRNETFFPPRGRGGSAASIMADKRPVSTPSATPWWRMFPTQSQAESDSRHDPPRSATAGAAPSRRHGGPLRGPRVAEAVDGAEATDSGPRRTVYV